MNMKSGKLKLILTVSFISGWYISKCLSEKSLVKNIASPSIMQYLNRFKEFYSSDSLGHIEKEFINLVNLGMSPSGAFDAIVFSGELN